MKKKFAGVWPTMITAFDENNHIDFKATGQMVNWYINKGCDGIFAVCQSSEMFFLNENEKTDLAKCVLDAAAGRIPVIASGHTDSDHSSQVEQLGRMAETGVDAVILISNRLAGEDEDEEKFILNLDRILRALPHVMFGIYECPYPYKRVVEPSTLKWAAETGRVKFLKDTCCRLDLIKDKLKEVCNTELLLFNANTATLLDSLHLGAAGYNGVMANFHPDIYKLLYECYNSDPEKAKEISDFLTMAAVLESRIYPISAKYHMQLEGIKMGIHTRSRDERLFDENARREVEALFAVENRLRREQIFNH